MNNPQISIIVPVYNAEKYLQECADSILKQTFTDFEVIFVDDGSADGSLGILNNYRNKDNRINILRQNHLGAGSARNLGINTARGKYIQFLDADDFFELNMLEELYLQAEKYNADLVMCNARAVAPNGDVITSRQYLNTDIIPLEKPFCRRNFNGNIFAVSATVAWNKFWLKDLIADNNLTFQNLERCNDFAFTMLAMSCAERIIAVDRQLINYRCHNDENTLQKKQDAGRRCIIKAIAYIIKGLKTRNLYNSLGRDFIDFATSLIEKKVKTCDDNQYLEFVKDLKAQMPNDWKLFRSALRKDYITPKYLNKIIGGRKVMLWGASLFIRKVLEKESAVNPNILGVIDCNKELWGSKCGNYKIYPPEIMKTMKFDACISTVLTNHRTVYQALSNELKQNYPWVELLPNIFEGEVEFND